jgi:hypothetical protein
MRFRIVLTGVPTLAALEIVFGIASSVGVPLASSVGAVFTKIEAYSYARLKAVVPPRVEAFTSRRSFRSSDPRP